jgi:hypothetical protein
MRETGGGRILGRGVGGWVVVVLKPLIRVDDRGRLREGVETSNREEKGWSVGYDGEGLGQPIDMPHPIMTLSGFHF